MEAFTILMAPGKTKVQTCPLWGNWQVSLFSRRCHFLALGISNFLEEISSLSHSFVFLYFFALIMGAAPPAGRGRALRHH